MKRFWDKVDKTDGCWLWTASVNPKTGYGQFSRHHGQPVDAHRFSCELAHGPIPERHDVHHICHVRRCVNPAHLFVGTRRDNHHDMVAKGRHDFSGLALGRNKG